MTKVRPCILHSRFDLINPINCTTIISSRKSKIQIYLITSVILYTTSVIKTSLLTIKLLQAGRFGAECDLPELGGSMTDAINFEQIGITNDMMFGSVFRNVEDCRELLQRILHLRIVELRLVEDQKSMNVNMSGKGIRLDIYAKDDEDNSYDIEMQLTNTEEVDLRSRYYHSEMDSYQIRKGMKYKYLKQSVVIFICNFDLFGENKSIYTFESICNENRNLILKDKRKTIFVNVHGDRAGLDDATVNLLDYFKTGTPQDLFTQRLQERVDEIRSDNEWRENYMTFEMKLDQRFEEGSEEKTKTVVKNMLRRGLPDEDIRNLAECEQSLIDEVRKNM